MAPPMPPPKDSAFLAPASHDDDARSIHSEQDTDSEDDSVLRDARTSADIREHDRSLLFEEEERDRILTENRQGRRGSGLSLPNPFKKILGKTYERVADHSGLSSESLGDENADARREMRRKRRERRQRRKDRLMKEASHGEDRELMYEMEEGEMKEGSTTGDSSDTDGFSDVEKEELHTADEKSRRQRKWGRLCYMYLLILLGFTLLGLGAWRLSMRKKQEAPAQEAPTQEAPVQEAPAQNNLFNNGTALFAPTTILISLDGFRADFLQRGLTPRLNAFIAEGVSPNYMLPSFPSVTFPNHYTLATGLYPESHGIVGNTFWDPATQKEFSYTDPSKSMQREWWGGEPIWVTAEMQGIRTAIHMWPGSEAHISDVEPSFLDKYNGKEPLSNKVDRVLELLDKPGLEDKTVLAADMRPQLIAAYVPNVDSDGHKYGPNSTEMRTTISNVDHMLDQLFTGLEERNLTNIVNVVIVSDHGMATTSTDRLIQFEDLVDLNLIERIDGWPLYGLRPKNLQDLPFLYMMLGHMAVVHRNFHVYLRDVSMPERYHFSKNDRIAPLWIIPEAGWAIVTKNEFNVAEAKAKGEEYHPKGLHGYDHENPLMRAIFIARGPAFPHSPNSRIDVFQNIEVYNIICDSLGLTPQPNNGTLRLPLKPIGLHSPETSPEVPADPVPSVTPGPESGRPVVSVAPGVETPIASIAPVVESPAASIPPVVESPVASIAPGVESPVASIAPGVESPAASIAPVVEKPSIPPIPTPLITPAIPNPTTPVSEAPVVTPDPTAPATPSPTGANGDGNGSDGNKGGGGFWDYWKGKIEEIKDWVEGLISSVQNNKPAKVENN